MKLGEGFIVVPAVAQFVDDCWWLDESRLAAVSPEFTSVHGRAINPPVIRVLNV